MLNILGKKSLLRLWVTPSTLPSSGLQADGLYPTGPTPSEAFGTREEWKAHGVFLHFAPAPAGALSFWEQHDEHSYYCSNYGGCIESIHEGFSVPCLDYP